MIVIIAYKAIQERTRYSRGVQDTVGGVATMLVIQVIWGLCVLVL